MLHVLVRRVLSLTVDAQQNCKPFEATFGGLAVFLGLFLLGFNQNIYKIANLFHFL